MIDNFNVQFFDLMVYLFPGAVVLCACLCLRPDFVKSRFAKEQHIFPLILAFFVFAFIAGYLSHIGATTAQGIFERIQEKRCLSVWLDETAATKVAEGLASKKLPIKFVDRLAFYRYAETTVEEKMPKRAARASRLQALALFGRNLVVPCILLAAAVWWQWFRKKLFPTVAIGAACIAIAGILLRGWMVYSKVSVYVVLWSFSVWCELPNE